MTMLKEIRFGNFILIAIDTVFVSSIDEHLCAIRPRMTLYEKRTSASFQLYSEKTIFTIIKAKSFVVEAEEGRSRKPEFDERKRQTEKFAISKASLRFRLIKIKFQALTSGSNGKGSKVLGKLAWQIAQAGDCLLELR